MFPQSFTCILFVAPLLVAAELLPPNGRGYSQLGEHEALGMFRVFSSSFDKQYGSQAEHDKRFAIFKDNLRKIDQLNREERGTAKYGITRFADLTYEEFVQNFTGGRMSQSYQDWHANAMETEPEVEIEFMDDDFARGVESDSAVGDYSEDEDGVRVVGSKVFLPKTFDYRTQNAVTPAKDQGACRSCWAFSTIANIEGVYAKKSKKLVDLSEQVLLDCDKVNRACGGGWMKFAVKRLVRLGGVPATSTYGPYKAKREKCHFTKDMAEVRLAGTKSIPKNEKKIARALVKNGPLSIAVCMSNSFMFYKGGVYNPTPEQCNQDEDEVDHAVTIVAYGEEVTSSGEKLPYWVLKNSYGPNWGENGFMKIVRGKNACSLKSFVSTAYL